MRAPIQIPAAAQKAAMSDEQASQKLEELKRRWTALRDIKITRLADKERLAAEIENAAREAEAKFGTRDVEELRKRVIETREENAKALASFEAKLDEVQARLAEISSVLP